MFDASYWLALRRSPAHAAAGTTPTSSPAPRCRTPLYAQPGRPPGCRAACAGGIAATAISERSQIFLSVLPRKDLSVILPVDPAPYARQSGYRVLTGQGHHGVGDLQVDVSDEDALDRFFKIFREWLGPRNSASL
jgi:hypothetical protein